MIPFPLDFTELPYNDYFEYFGPDFKLHISPSNMTNQNTNDYLEKIKWAPLMYLHVICELCLMTSQAKRQRGHDMLLLRS